jgi:hypothetical protein
MTVEEGTTVPGRDSREVLALVLFLPMNYTVREFLVTGSRHLTKGRSLLLLQKFEEALGKLRVRIK